MNETIRVQALDGTWTTLGLAKAAGITPESIAASANEWGPDQLTCTLQRDPTEIAVDLSTWTPCELEIDGTVVWDGRVKEAPKQGGASPQLSLVCEGWQYHLDDDLYERCYVHSALSEWADYRADPAADLTQAPQAGTVTAEDIGGLVLGLPNTSSWATNQVVGVMLDMGPVERATTCSFNFGSPVPPAAWCHQSGGRFVHECLAISGGVSPIERRPNVGE